MAKVKNCGQSRMMYGAAAIRFFDDYVALFGAGALYLVYRALRLSSPPSLPSRGLGPSNWLRDASDVRAYQIQDSIIIVDSIPKVYMMSLHVLCRSVLRYVHT